MTSDNSTAVADAPKGGAWSNLSPEERAERVRKMQAGRKKPQAAVAHAPAPDAPDEPEAEKLHVVKRGCWFEFNADLPAEVVRGRPERIFTDDDPRWAKFEESKSLTRGSFCIGSYQRVGDEFVPRSVTTPCALQTGWADAREKMQKFNADGRAWDTPRHDALRHEEEKVERAQMAQATLIANALKPLAEARR